MSATFELAAARATCCARYPMRGRGRQALLGVLGLLMALSLIPAGSPAAWAEPPDEATAITSLPYTISQGGTYQLPPAEVKGAISVTTSEPVTIVGNGCTVDPATRLIAESPNDITIDATSAHHASITLRDVFISQNSSDQTAKSVLDFSGANNTLAFEGTNDIDYEVGGGSNPAAIHVPVGTALNILGSGTAYLYKHAQGSLIGGSSGEYNGEIVFGDANTKTGPTLFVKGSKQGAVIGAGSAAAHATDMPGPITFNGGTYNLVSNSHGAVIGGSAGSTGASAGTQVFVSGGNISINVDYAGSAIGGGSYDIYNDASGGQVYIQGGSLRVYIDKNAASNLAIPGWAEGVNDAAIMAQKLNNPASSQPVHKAAFDTSLLSEQTSYYNIKVDGSQASYYSGALHGYRFVQESLLKEEQLEIPSTPFNWEPASGDSADNNIYLYLTAARHTVSVNGEDFIFSWNPALGAFTVGQGQEGYDDSQPVPALDEDGYYRLASLEHLIWFADKVSNNATAGADNAICGRLLNDIDATGTAGGAAFSPIGTSSPATKAFIGALDGGGHTVTLALEGTGTFRGLVGFLGAGGIVRDVTVAGTVSGGAQTAGVVGASNGGVVDNCVNLAAVTSTGSNTGGVVGRAYGSSRLTTLRNAGALSSAAASGTSAWGGVVGALSDASSLVGATNTGSITMAAGNNFSIGGIVGSLASSAQISQLANFGSVSAPSTNTTTNVGTGGVVGSMTAAGGISACSNTGDVSGGSFNVGGIVGSMSGSGQHSIIDAYNRGNVTNSSANANAAVAGILACYFQAGTLTIQNTYSVGNVALTASSSARIGAILGFNHASANIANVSNNYYDTASGGAGGTGTQVTSDVLRMVGVTLLNSGGNNWVADLPGEAAQNDGLPLLRASQAPTGITVTSGPTRLSYVAGQAFDLSGFSATASYADGKTLPVSQFAADVAVLSASHNGKSVTITARAGSLQRSFSYPLEVVENEVAGLTLTTVPTKLVYHIGDTFTADGAAVTATYTNGTTQTFYGSALTVPPFAQSPAILTASDEATTITYTYAAPAKTTYASIVIPVAVLAQDPSQGSDGYYEIGSWQEMLWFARQLQVDNITNVNARLTTDIDLTGKNYQAIGTNSRLYVGSFDGAGHKVTLGINTGNTGYQGLFGCIGAGAVVENVVVDGSVTGASNTAGVIGYAKNATVRGCVNYARVQATSDSFQYYGGVVGYADGSTLSGCENHAAISGIKGSIGGIVGYFSAPNNSSAQLVGCTNTGDVSAATATGLLVGGIAGTIADNRATPSEAPVAYRLYNAGTISGNELNTSSTAYGVGGIAGIMSSSSQAGAKARIAECVNAGNIAYSGLYAGGILGNATRAVEVSDCYNSGNISHGADGGDFSAQAAPPSTAGAAAGIVGLAVTAGQTSIVNSYNIGAVAANITPERYGALLGAGTPAAITNSYWLNTSAVGGNALGESRTSEELKAMAAVLGEAYVADASDSLAINSGYPILAWQKPEPSAPPVGEPGSGDLDGDGTVTSAEALMLARHVISGAAISDAQKQAADIDGDDVLTMADAVLMLRKAAGLS